LLGVQGKYDNIYKHAYYSLSILLCRTRNCIGKNFALQEMRILIATMLKTYDIQPIEQEMIGSHERRQFITLTIPNNSFNIKIKRRS
jgi:hypothetical protein